jgi:uncharacterized HAD superfamily protein
MAVSKVIVFDIDGTVANNQHRIHWISSRPKNWKACDAAMHKDGCYDDIIWLLNSLRLPDTRIIFCTGRSEATRKVTEEWLKDNIGYYDALYMRSSGDYRKDSIVKVELLHKITYDYTKPYIWFDDRQQVVDAIRNEGVRVLQVAPGDF